MNSLVCPQAKACSYVLTSLACLQLIHTPAARRCLTQMGKAAILRTDIRIRKGVHEANESPEDGKNEGAQGSQKAGTYLFAGAPTRGERRAGQTHPSASGSRSPVLQRGALRRAAAATPHASRPRLARGPCHPPDSQAGAAGRLLGLAGALRLFRVRLSRARTGAAGLVAG